MFGNQVSIKKAKFGLPEEMTITSILWGNDLNQLRRANHDTGSSLSYQTKGMTSLLKLRITTLVPSHIWPPIFVKSIKKNQINSGKKTKICIMWSY